MKTSVKKQSSNAKNAGFSETRRTEALWFLVNVVLSTFLHIANADGTVNAHDAHLKKLLIASCFGLQLEALRSTILMHSDPPISVDV